MNSISRNEVRKARIEWRKQMSELLDVLLYDNKFQFDFSNFSDDSIWSIQAGNAMKLRSYLMMLKETLDNSNVISELLTD